MNEEELYSIGDAAHRSGLSVGTVRFYSDEGVVEATGTTESGHRLYDVHAIARLELVRTLRDLDTGLDEIRRLLRGGTNLQDLLTTHLEVVQRQEHVLRARQAVLRALIKQGGTTAQADLMHRLVSMPDEERERTVEDFWNEVGEGLDVPDGFVDRLRTMRPRLHEDPTAAQLQAWIELADLLRDAKFRDAVRAYLRDGYSTGPGRFIASEPAQELIHTDGAAISEELIAAHHAGEAARSPRVQGITERFVAVTATLADGQDTARLRDRLAAAFLLADEFMREEEGPYAAGHAWYNETHGRYLSLVAVINGNAAEETDPLPYLAWFAEALRSSTSGS